MPDLTGFHNIRFPITLSLGAVGGEEMQSTIHVTGSGYEYRNADWEEVRGRWDVSRHVNTLEQSALLVSFFRARKGSTYSFRFKPLDLVDRTVVGSQFGVGDGIKTVFPLYKVYDDTIDPQSRRVVLPVDEGVYSTDTPFAIYKNTVLVDPGDYTVDFRNGRITFDVSAVPANGVLLTWDGEFDVPVRFGMSQLRRTMVTHETVAFEEVSLIEILPQEILETPDSTSMPPIVGNWTLIFEELFDGSTLNLAKWTPNWLGSTETEITDSIQGTSEDAAYDPDQVNVSGGYLSLATVDNPVTVGANNYLYRSGLIQSDGKFSFTGGYVEARIFTSASSGTSLANLPMFLTYGQPTWPANGEMDVLIGLSGVASYHFHSSTVDDGASYSGTNTGWHVWGANWVSGSQVDYYRDGVYIGSISTGITSAPMFLVIGYGVGGVGGTTVVPSVMLVDYVRVFQSS